MESRIKLFGHALHPILIVFPLGLLSTAVAFDVVWLITGEARWYQIAYYLIAAGLIGGLAAAVPGWIDWFAIPSRTRAKRIGLVHGLGNVIVLGLFALSWVLRRGSPGPPPTEAVVASVIGLGIALVTGWLGGELVERLGVSVSDGAHLDAPSSLSQLPASMNRRAAPVDWGGGPDRRARRHEAWAGVERRASVAR